MSSHHSECTWSGWSKYLVVLPAAYKRVMTGPKSQVLHKEELGVSNVERRVKRKVEENARVQQRKKSAMAERQGEGSSKVRPVGKRSPVSVAFRPMHCIVCVYVMLG